MAAAGGDAVRVEIDWARCEPIDGSLDEDALRRYRDLLDACRHRRLEPAVVLHHVALPAWLGDAFWLDLRSPERFAVWTSEVARRLVDHAGPWIPLEQPNRVALARWITGTLPPRRRLAPGDLVRSLDHLLAASVLAHAAVHRHRGDAAVWASIGASRVYEVDGLLTDALVGRSRGVARHELHRWLTDRRAACYRALPPSGHAEAALRALARSAVPLEQALPRALAEIWSATADPPLDNLVVVARGRELPAAWRRDRGDGDVERWVADGVTVATVCPPGGVCDQGGALSTGFATGVGPRWVTAGRGAWPSSRRTRRG